jgi:hypothetical protein
VVVKFGSGPCSPGCVIRDDDDGGLLLVAYDSGSEQWVDPTADDTDVFDFNG